VWRSTILKNFLPLGAIGTPWWNRTGYRIGDVWDRAFQSGVGMHACCGVGLWIMEPETGWQHVPKGRFQQPESEIFSTMSHTMHPALTTQ